MRLLVYLAHPAQYHFFKNIIRRLRSDGNQVRILAKSKDVLEELLREEFGIVMHIPRWKRF